MYVGDGEGEADDADGLALAVGTGDGDAVLEPRSIERAAATSILPCTTPAVGTAVSRKACWTLCGEAPEAAERRSAAAPATSGVAEEVPQKSPYAPPAVVDRLQ